MTPDPRDVIPAHAPAVWGGLIAMALGAGLGALLWLALPGPQRLGLSVLLAAAAGAAVAAGLAAGLAVWASFCNWRSTAIKPWPPDVQRGAGPAAAVTVEQGLKSPTAASIESFCGAPVRDAISGAYNPLNFVAAADREWSRVLRHGEDAAMLLLELDFFMRLNLAYGRPCGDAVLVEVCRLSATTLRGHDLLTRFGDGVLLVYLPLTEMLGALDVAERIRTRVTQLALDWQAQRVAATVSVGVALVSAAHASLDAVVLDASAALREAQIAGGNCVRAAPPRVKPAPARSSRF